MFLAVFGGAIAAVLSLPVPAYAVPSYQSAFRQTSVAKSLTADEMNSLLLASTPPAQPSRNLIFFFGCVSAMWLGRKIGWGISRNILYTSGWFVCIVVCLTWTGGLAYGFHRFILATNPVLLLKILGYGIGWYTSIPNFGLVRGEATIPKAALSRHRFISTVPSVFFLSASVVLGFFR